MSNLIQFGNQYVDFERVKKYAERQLNRTVKAINEDYGRKFTGKFAYRAFDSLKFTFFLYDENRDNVDKAIVVVYDNYDEQRDIDTFDVYVTTDDYSKCVGDNLVSINDRDLEIAIDVACSLIEQMDWSVY